MRIRSLTAFLLLFAPAIGTAAASSQTVAPLDPAAEQIALTIFSPCEGVAVIETTPPCSTSVLMDADGTHVMPGVPAGDWSPDGTRLFAYGHGASQNDVEIQVMAATGGARTNLTNHPAYDWWPAWSPDGTRIAFASDRDGALGLYVMNADGSDVLRIVTGVGMAYQPSWSPDGARLAFRCIVDPVSSPWWSVTGDVDLCAINADGSGFARLTHAPANGENPTWSPDSSRLAFTCALDSSSNFDICAINADGSGFAQLTNDPGFDASPDWSPDGTRILFVTSRYGGDITEIVVMNPDGSDVTRVAPGDSPSWSSDGTRIAFVYVVPWDPDEPWRPYSWVSVINADGTGLHVLAWGQSPWWRPWAGGLNDRPVASFTVECSGRTCTFDASSSSDDRNIVSYGWSVGDGTGAATVTHTFPGGRSYDVRLIVMDDDGALATSVQSVDLNERPVASFTTTCSGLRCTFDGSGSSDDGWIFYYSWSFGDGTYGSGATASHTYAAAGTYFATLHATDNAHGTGTHSETVRVVHVNALPVPSSTFTCSGLTCSFSAVGSFDPDGTIVSHVWTFGDATTGSGATVNRTYAAAGTYAVTLTVTDNGAATSTKAQSVTVVAPPGLHVADLDGAPTIQSTRWTAIVTIRAHDISHGRVANAAVSGSWNDGVSGSCITNASGQCAVSRSGIRKTTASVTFTVANVALAALVYKRTDNHDPDGDSNGSSISVSKP